MSERTRASEYPDLGDLAAHDRSPTISLSVDWEGLTGGSRSKEAASKLRHELGRSMPDALVVPAETSNDHKGIETDLFNVGVALIDAGALTRLLDCLKRFLSHDRKRGVTLKDDKGVVVTNARGEVFRIDASNVGDEVVIEAIKAAVGLTAS